MANKINQEKINEIVNLYSQKFSTKEISNKIGVSVSTIERYLNQYNLLEKRPKKYIKQETLDEIKRLYVEEKLGSTTISRKLNLGERTVTKHLINMGIKLRSNGPSIDINKVIKLYKENKIPIHVIAANLNSSEERISKILKQNNVEIYGNGIPRFNYHVFDSIDTEEKAYWLGFIFADGYIATINENKPNYAFELTLKADDYEHLNKFNSFMEFNGNNVKIARNHLYYSTNVKEGISSFERCRWCISNKHLWEILNSYGCTPKKSLTLQFPDESIFKSTDLIRHFIRGYFDGDGCVSYFNKEHTMLTWSIAGKSKDMIVGILQYLPIKLNLHYTNSMYVINTCGKKALLLLHYLFDDSNIFLNRKQQIFSNFCRLYEKSDRLLETKIMEGCDANHEVNSEIKESESPQRVEIEPEKSE